MHLAEMVRPLQKLAEGGSAMTVLGFLLGGQLGKRFVDLGKEEKRIVAESVRAAGGVQNQPFGLAMKCRQGVSVARHGNHADEASGAVFVRNFMQLAQQPR